MKLLNFNFSTSCLEVSCELLCIFLRDAFLDGLGARLNEVLSVLKTKAANVLNELNNQAKRIWELAHKYASADCSVAAHRKVSKVRSTKDALWTYAT